MVHAMLFGISKIRTFRGRCRENASRGLCLTSLVNDARVVRSTSIYFWQIWDIRSFRWSVTCATPLSGA